MRCSSARTACGKWFLTSSSSRPCCPRRGRQPTTWPRDCCNWPLPVAGGITSVWWSCRCASRISRRCRRSSLHTGELSCLSDYPFHSLTNRGMRVPEALCMLFCVLYDEPASFCKGSSERRNLHVTTSSYSRAHPATPRGDGCAGAAGSLQTRCYAVSCAGACLIPERGESVHVRRCMEGLSSGGNVPRLIV